MSDSGQRLSEFDAYTAGVDDMRTVLKTVAPAIKFLSRKDALEIIEVGLADLRDRRIGRGQLPADPSAAMDDDELLSRAKQRAYDLIDQGDIGGAIPSLVGSLMKRECFTLSCFFAALTVDHTWSAEKTRDWIANFDKRFRP